MDTSLEWKIVVDQRRFIREEDERQQSWNNQVTDFMRSRNREEYMAEISSSLAFENG